MFTTCVLYLYQGTSVKLDTLYASLCNAFSCVADVHRPVKRLSVKHF